MNSFVNAIGTPSMTTTENGMAAFDKSGSGLVDMFYRIGAARRVEPKIVETMFARALAEDKVLATKILLWARDVRGGAGERLVFRNLMLYMERNYPKQTKALIPFIYEFGRWDDLFIFQTKEVLNTALSSYAIAIRNGNRLAAKWAPRKGLMAVKLRQVLGMTPKSYRKTIVGLTDVVEQKMCAGDWDSIEFGKLPSIASKAYQKAFMKHATINYNQYVESLKAKDGKINANAIFPHDVIMGLRNGIADVAIAQWEALPNYMSDAKVLPMVDVSGSMSYPAGGNPNVRCLDVAVALGLYISEKNPGVYNGAVLTFSEKSELIQLKGNLQERMYQLNHIGWEMNTNLNKAFETVLNKAVSNNVKAEDMPEYILILSDMQFDAAVRPEDRAIDMIRLQYKQAGYEMPKVVFWNLRDAGITPVSFNEEGTMMVSGFSPAIMKAILACKNIDSYSIMLEAINVDRYKVAEIIWR